VNNFVCSTKFLPASNPSFSSMVSSPATPFGKYLLAKRLYGELTRPA